MREEEFNLSDSDKKELLKLARLSIEEELYPERKQEISREIERRLKKHSVFGVECGAFVTLKQKGRLRGCIGYVVGVKTLGEAVVDVAKAAAFEDTRFAPLTRQEYETKGVEIEISVLSPLKKVESIEEIEVGKHGLLMKRDFQQGLLLPQVPVEYGWDKITFLQETCFKAGMEPNCWEHGAEVFSFTAIVFSEEDFE